MQRLGYPKFTNMLFAIPFSGRPLPPEILLSFKSMATPMNFNNVMQVVTGQPIAVAREHFGDMAVQSKCKFIFFWDEDVACPPQTIPELVYKMEHTPDAAVIGGVYCLKRHPSEPLVFQGNGNGPSWDWKAGEFFECSGVGMGCTLVRTEALKDLKRPWFKTVHDYSKMLDGLNAMESWTEDLWFCQRVTDTHKWKVYCDSSLLCTHYDVNTGEPFNLPPDSKPVQHLAVAKGKKKILDIGSAILPTGHYACKEGIPIKCDFDTFDVQTDYRCDLRKIPFDNEAFDIVFSGVLETFSTLEIDETLTEWRRVLKTGGELRLVVANMPEILKGIQYNGDGDGNGNGNGASINQIFNSNGIRNRKCAFSKESLKERLESVGFKPDDIEFVPSDRVHIGIRCIR